MLLVNSNVPMSTYLEELNTMVIMQQVPMCVPEVIWNTSFANLIAADPYGISLFDTFCEFAIYVHGLECEEQHTLNEFECYTCPELDNAYVRKLTIEEV